MFGSVWSYFYYYKLSDNNRTLYVRTEIRNNLSGVQNIFNLFDKLFFIRTFFTRTCEAEKCPKFKNMLGTYPSRGKSKNAYFGYKTKSWIFSANVCQCNITFIVQVQLCFQVFFIYYLYFFLTGQGAVGLPRMKNIRC